jgi:hypothetical protein
LGLVFFLAIDVASAHAICLHATSLRKPRL